MYMRGVHVHMYMYKLIIRLIARALYIELVNLLIFICT